MQTGSKIGELPTVEKDGYTLAGWSTSATGGSFIDKNTRVNNDVTFYAIWVVGENTTITFRDNCPVTITYRSNF